MKRLTFKSICEKLALNEIVKVSTTFGWIVCKSSSVKTDEKKKKVHVPCWCKWSNDWSFIVLPVKCILSVDETTEPAQI